MNFVEMMTEKDSLTANGALTNSTSHNFNVDLFFLAGACRKETQENIEKALTKSYEFDRVKTLKIIFWAGDIRQGAGERRFFKLALKWLNDNHADDLQTYLSFIPEYSRWDVLFDLANINDTVLNYICENIKTNGLLCKWLPRKVFARDVHKNKNIIKNKNILKDKFGNKIKKASGNWEIRTEEHTLVKRRLLYDGLAGKIQKKLCLSPKEYRQLLVKNTKVVETKMCAKKWNEIEYSKVPSVALNKYNKAWYRNDEERFKAYLESVKKGETKINASAIFPHDIIKGAVPNDYSYDRTSLNDAQITQWNNLPNWLVGENSIMPVCDVSGSMYGTPITISVALGLYISERNVGPFKDAFLTFSDEPTMQILKGDINQRIQQLLDAAWGNSTNISAVFETILNKAIENRLPQEQMPKTVLIISDMEFNYCGNMTNFENIKRMYQEAHYELPNIVFWNVNGRTGNMPVTINDKGVALISGASPSIVKAVLTNEISPIKVMNNAIEVERYSFIK